MTTPFFHLNTGPAAVPGVAVTLALTLDTDPDNPVVGDLHLRNGQIHFWDKTEQRRQKIRAILLFFKGEWYLNPSAGIPYFPNIIGGRKRELVLSIFRQAFIAGLPDLAKILSINMDFDGPTRAARVNFALLFDDGEVINSADFGPVEIKVG